LQKTEKSKLADLSIQTADPKRTRCFDNMQQMARFSHCLFKQQKPIPTVSMTPCVDARKKARNREGKTSKQ